MNQYDHYTSLQLFEQATKATDSERNYLIRLLLQRKDNRQYLEKLLVQEDKIKTDIIRLFSNTEMELFAPFLAKLLNKGNRNTKKIIISRLGTVHNSLMLTALMERASDEREDAVIRKMSITVIGNSDSQHLLGRLIRLFDKLDHDGKTEIMLALSKIGNTETIPFLEKTLREETGAIKSMAEEILGRLKRSTEGEPTKKIDLSIYKIWVRDPLTYPDTHQLYFTHDNRGLYEELKAGETELRISFQFRIERDMIVFITGTYKEQRSGYRISESFINHPYQGKLKCQLLQFSNPAIKIRKISITASNYYYIYKDF